MTSPPFHPSTREGGARQGTLELSIVVPAFNEEQRLPKSLQSIRAYLKSRSLRAEVLIVDDGSTDATTKVVQASRTGFPELRLISNGRNRGKGVNHALALLGIAADAMQPEGGVHVTGCVRSIRHGDPYGTSEAM